MFSPSALEKTGEEDAASEGEFDGHGRPHTLQTVFGSEGGSKCQSDGPH